MPTIELLITGKVQGVFYRASARRQAEALGLTGWVKNNSDGSVLVRASGTMEALEQLEQWCKKGPQNARVAAVQKRELPEERFENFVVMR